MKSTKFFRKMTAVCLAAALLSTGCGKPAETIAEPGVQESQAAAEENGQKVVNAEGESGGRDDLITLLRTKYDTGIIDYSGETISLGREEAIQIRLGYNPWEDTAIPLTESFVVYQDAELKCPLDVAGYDWDLNSGVLTIKPPAYGPAEVVLMDMLDSPASFMTQEDETGWGNLPQLYIAAYVDAKTGNALEGNPLVTVLEIKSALAQAPQVKFSQDEYGSARFSWKEVPGAEEYFIFRIKKYESGIDGYLDVFASTTDTEWTAERSMSMDDTETVTMNDMFRQYLVSEDYRGETEEDDFDYVDWEEYYGVMAVNADGNSHISNLFNSSELAHMLPYSIAYNDNEETTGVSVSGTANLPATMGIVMCDGTISQRVLEYDKESIEKSVDSSFYEIGCRAYGTPFTSSYLVTDQDWDTLDQELDEINERQEKLKNKGGNVEAELSFIDEEEQDNTIPEEIEEAGETRSETSPDEEMTAESDEEDVRESAEEGTQEEEKGDGDNITIDSTDTAITANSALSEYLAIQMLHSEEVIDVSAFPESADTTLLVDAFYEAQYQNPLILGVQGAGMDRFNGILYVMYDYDAQTTEAKRKEVMEKAAQITDEIITDGMSDLDKELAINQYLCDNAEYDNAALENAEENDFKIVDKMYYDSFTAYGVLVNRVGVCASYSAAFKLLADAAGLDSIVVTGYLDGNLPHAWNKVKLDGQWNIVDSTNNDNEVIQNALLNLSDTAAYSTLVEDDRFVLDNSRYNYEAPSDDKEYYRITDNYFAIDELREVLVEKLQTEGKAILRTDYDLDDETFNQIAQETADEIRGNLSGMCWMGVIRLEKK